MIDTEMYHPVFRNEVLTTPAIVNVTVRNLLCQALRWEFGSESFKTYLAKSTPLLVVGGQQIAPGTR